MVSVICISVLCTEEQRWFTLSDNSYIESTGTQGSFILSIKWSYSGPPFHFQECSVNSPDYGPLPPNSPGWCLAPFDPEGILRSKSSPCSLYYFLFFYHYYSVNGKAGLQLIIWIPNNPYTNIYRRLFISTPLCGG